MKLNQLYYFMAICNNRNNFSKAAEELFVTQPCLSSALKSLETEFDVRLFDKSGVNTTLTPEGRLFLDYANQIFSNIHSLKQQLNNMKNSHNHLNIVLAPNIGGQIFCRLFLDFKEKYPDISFQIKTVFSPDACKEVEEGKNEIAIINFHDGFPYNSSVSAVPFCKRETCFCTYKGNPLAERNVITPELLHREPMALLTLGHPENPSGYILDIFNNTPYFPNIMFYHPQIEFIKQLVSSHFCSTFMFSDLVTEKNLCCIPLEPQRICDVGIIYREETLLSENASLFIKFCQNYSFSL